MSKAPPGPPPYSAVPSTFTPAAPLVADYVYRPRAEVTLNAPEAGGGVTLPPWAVATLAAGPDAPPFRDLNYRDPDVEEAEDALQAKGVRGTALRAPDGSVTVHRKVPTAWPGPTSHPPPQLHAPGGYGYKALPETPAASWTAAPASAPMSQGSGAAHPAPQQAPQPPPQHSVAGSAVPPPLVQEGGLSPPSTTADSHSALPPAHHVQHGPPAMAPPSWPSSLTPGSTPRTFVSAAGEAHTAAQRAQHAAQLQRALAVLGGAAQAPRSSLSAHHRAQHTVPAPAPVSAAGSDGWWARAIGAQHATPGSGWGSALPPSHPPTAQRGAALHPSMLHVPRSAPSSASSAQLLSADGTRSAGAGSAGHAQPDEGASSPSLHAEAASVARARAALGASRARREALEAALARAGT